MACPLDVDRDVRCGHSTALLGLLYLLTRVFVTKIEGRAFVTVDVACDVHCGVLCLLLFVVTQNQIRLMIGGALGEARGDLMPGFVEAALKTPYKIRVPLAPAEGLVLESQV